MNPVVHFEFPYDDAARIQRFYQAAFGWEMQQYGPEMGNYVVCTTARPGGISRGMPNAVPGAINGGFYERRADWPAQYPSVVIAVEDIRAAMKRVTDAGGEVLGEPMMIPTVGDYVSFYDTEKNRVSLLQPLPMQA
jgi:predicted enzyme related to lactoylglutathione lyase